MDGPMVECGNKELRLAPLTNRLRSKRDALRQELDDVNAALTALEANPELGEILDKLSRIGLRY